MEDKILNLGGLQLDRPIVFFDLETTGVNVDQDRIVEMAALKINPDGTHQDECQRFNPGRPIPKGASEVHGIYDDDVKDCPTFDQHSQRVEQFFAGCDMGGYYVARFDIPLLYNELHRAGHYLDMTVAVVDVCQVFHKREPRDLEAAVRFYCDQAHDNAHTALADTWASINVLIAQVAKYTDMSRTPRGIQGETQDPDAVDLGGKLKWEGSRVVLTFGKNKGTSLDQLDRGYLYWIKENAVVGPDAMPIIEQAIKGEFPYR